MPGTEYIEINKRNVFKLLMIQCRRNKKIDNYKTV